MQKQVSNQAEVTTYVSKYIVKSMQILTYVLSSDAVSGWAGRALAHPEIGVLINPIPTRGADYAHRITACPPGFAKIDRNQNSQ